MEVFVDDNQVDADGLSAGTVEEALRHLQSTVCPPDYMVIGLQCDGSEVPAGAMAETLQKPASSFDKLEVFTCTKDALVVDAMTQALACLDDTEEACGRAAQFLTEGATTKATETLGECLRTWMQIHEAMGKSIEMLQIDVEQATVNDKRLIELIVKPKETLLQVKEALQARDYVLLADILQYEFPEVLEQWRALLGKLKREAEELATQHS